MGQEAKNGHFYPDSEVVSMYECRVECRQAVELSHKI